jgi:hypothetical protein
VPAALFVPAAVPELLMVGMDTDVTIDPGSVTIEDDNVSPPVPVVPVVLAVPVALPLTELVFESGSTESGFDDAPGTREKEKLDGRVAVPEKEMSVGSGVPDSPKTVSDCERAAPAESATRSAVRICMPRPCLSCAPCNDQSCLSEQRRFILRVPAAPRGSSNAIG